MLQGLFDESLRASNARQARLSRELLEERCALVSEAPDAYEALQPAIKLIAEIKRRSPSRGFLAEIPDAKALGAGYESAGAHAISVLTEESGFGGKLSDLQEVSQAVSIPTLRKDFISNEYQILEAKAAGASMVLLILAQLSKAEFQSLYDFSKSIGLEPLVETHSAEEIAIAADSGARLIGINTRDLETFKTDIGLFEQLAARLPSGCVKIAESSVKQLADVERYRDAGADCVLVGEALVTGDWATLIPEFTSVS
ncbi:MAG: indole-3-glycerol-phosphate synthase [Actinobacteria bacterium]|nr:indole-3-glycerol-phosphate synthase [Actinomycetota bacterium]